ncbi:hypothetical protein BDW68DRAFT_182739 [Aspergillus falconensis]
MGIMAHPRHGACDEPRHDVTSYAVSDRVGWEFAGPRFTVYKFFRFFYEVLQTYNYWLMAEIKGAQADGDVARTTGILRSWESIGSTIAYTVDATDWPSLNQMILGFALWGSTIPFTLLAVFGNWNQSQTVEAEGESSGDDLETQRVTVDPDWKD